jgi:hypothetical protein
MNEAVRGEEGAETVEEEDSVVGRDCDGGDGRVEGKRGVDRRGQGAALMAFTRIIAQVRVLWQSQPTHLSIGLDCSHIATR